VKLPFNVSCSFTKFHFDIIQSDILTSPVTKKKFYLFIYHYCFLQYTYKI